MVTKIEPAAAKMISVAIKSMVVIPQLLCVMYKLSFVMGVTLA